MASQWSGLAPAVNAHLDRWKRSDKEWFRLDQSTRRQQRQSKGSGSMQFVLTPETYPIAYVWAMFARSWGLPTPGGGVVTPETYSTEGMTISGKGQSVSTEASEKNGIALMEREHLMLNRAETVYVSAEVVDRITYAAQSIDPEPLHATDLFAPSGLIVLEKPILLPDYHPGTGVMTDYVHVGIRAIGWTPESIAVSNVEDYDTNVGAINSLERRPGTMIFTYTTNDDWKNTYARDIVKAIKNGTISSEEAEPLLTTPDGHLLHPDEFLDFATFNMGSFSGRDHLIPSDVMAWAFGRSWSHRPELDYIPGTVDSSVAFMRRWILTLMRFSWQKILVPHSPPPSKKLHTRMVDAKRPSATFSVLRLRRTTQDNFETGTGQKLTYRVKTRGHWRNVYVPSLGPATLEDGSYNPDSHRRQWIEAFWRGPIDGPLGPEHKATVIVR